jgi:ubiquinone/menaquinone biosynthesis C-methylase UbiE
LEPTMDLHKEFFEELADEWDSQQPVDRSAHLHQLIEKIVPKLGTCKSILNIGSGTGALTDILVQHYPASEVISIDIAFAMVQKNRFQDPSTELVQADVHALPFNCQTFDAVICHNSFPHFQNHILSMQEMFRVLQIGKFLVILHDISRDQVNAVHRNATSQVIHHDMLPEPARLEGLMKKCGLRYIEVSEGEDFFLAIGQK